jgi:hypothetical protein
MPGAMAFVVGAIGTSGMPGYVGLTLAAATGCGGGDCKVEDQQQGWCKHEQFHLFAFHPLASQSVTPPRARARCRIHWSVLFYLTCRDHNARGLNRGGTKRHVSHRNN